MSVTGCVDPGGGGGGTQQGFLPDDKSWPDGVYGRVLGYFESAGTDAMSPLPGAYVEGIVEGETQEVQAGRSGRYALDLPPGSFYTRVKADGFRVTENARLDFSGSPYETNVYALSDTSLSEQAGLAGVAFDSGLGVIVAHLVDADTGLPVDGVAIANITANGETGVGLGLAGVADPAITQTVVNEDGNAAVMFFNLTPGDYTVDVGNDQAQTTLTAGSASVVVIRR
jgi:hypothetical protein